MIWYNPSPPLTPTTSVVKIHFIIILGYHLVTSPQFAIILWLKTLPNLKISVSWSTFVKVSKDITYLNKTSLTLVTSVLFRIGFMHVDISSWSKNKLFHSEIVKLISCYKDMFNTDKSSNEKFSWIPYRYIWCYWIRDAIVNINSHRWPEQDGGLTNWTKRSDTIRVAGATPLTTPHVRTNPRIWVFW